MPLDLPLCFSPSYPYFIASSSKGPHRPILSFSGDGDDDPTIDLLNAPVDDDEDEEDGDGGEGDDDEPEDDFNAAWEILELAKAIYQKQVQAGEDEEAQLKLADTFIALGDVSLETGAYRVQLLEPIS